MTNVIIDGVSVDSFPKEVAENQYILIEHKGKNTECVIGSFFSEIEAHKASKTIKHKDKTIVKGNAIYSNVYGVEILVDYEEVES